MDSLVMSLETLSQQSGDSIYDQHYQLSAVPDGQTFQLEVTATDLHGNTSAPASAEVKRRELPRGEFDEQPAKIAV